MGPATRRDQAAGRDGARGGEEKARTLRIGEETAMADQSTRTASGHGIASRGEWRAARLALLEQEKELTKRSDELARQRAALPWVPVDQDYTFVTEAGEATLDGLFSGRSQLIVYHLMFGPDWTEGCPSCSAIADGFEGIRAHLEAHDVSLVAISRAPLD